MALRKIKLAPNKQAWATQWRKDQLRGGVLHAPAAVEERLSAYLLKHIEKMTRATEREIKELFEDDAHAGHFAMDANVGSQANILMNDLDRRFQSMFDKIAKPAADATMQSVDAASESGLKSSLREMAGHLSFDTGMMSPEIKNSFAASVAEATALIKRVPQQYLGQVQGDVMRSIQTGRGLADLIPALEKRKISVRNWAHNVALDQTRKAYNGLNQRRLDSLGVKEYEWVHSGGSNHPRLLHKQSLNGKIFSFDKPPIIDERTGERGIPGQAINCRCTMRPVIRFDQPEKAKK